MSTKFKERKIFRLTSLEIIVWALALVVPVVISAVALAHVFPIEANELGDLFAGTVGVLFSLLAAILVYLSFQEQVEANKLLREEANFKYLLEESERLKKLFEEKYSFTFEDQYGKIQKFKGSQALSNLGQELHEHFNKGGDYRFGFHISWVSNTLFYLKSYYLFLNETKDLQLSETYRKTIQRKICLYFDEFMADSLDTFKRLTLEKDAKKSESQPEELKNLSIKISDITDNFERMGNFLTI